MDFELTDNQESIRDAVAKICSRFDDAYWLKRDKEGGFPADFHKAMADAGWLGICIPEGYGGSGLGIMGAAIMMRTISQSRPGRFGGGGVPAPHERVRAQPGCRVRHQGGMPAHAARHRLGRGEIVLRCDGAEHRP